MDLCLSQFQVQGGGLPAFRLRSSGMSPLVAVNTEHLKPVQRNLQLNRFYCVGMASIKAWNFRISLGEDFKLFLTMETGFMSAAFHSIFKGAVHKAI